MSSTLFPNLAAEKQYVAEWNRLLVRFEFVLRAPTVRFELLAASKMRWVNQKAATNGVVGELELGAKWI